MAAVRFLKVDRGPYDDRDVGDHAAADADRDSRTVDLLGNPIATHSRDDTETHPVYRGPRLVPIGKKDSWMTAPTESLVILVPGFSDRVGLATFLRTLNQAFAQSVWRASVLIVDEISREPLAENWLGESFDALDRIEILQLRSSLGPQRALALGLYHIHEYFDAQAVIIMRGDAGDRAE